ncbi:MAG TPA: cupin domain-containing protein [Actinomycetota bacterium]|jgi:hypothetical protein
MPGISMGSFDSPDEVRTPDKTKLEIVKLGNTTIGRATFQPGWRWSECIKPVVGTDSCQVHHVGMVVSGTLHIVHNDGTEGEAGPGDAYVVEPGHEAWVVGDEPFVAYEFDSTTAQEYAKE